VAHSVYYSIPIVVGVCSDSYHRILKKKVENK